MPRELHPENLRPIRDTETARELQGRSVEKRKENQAMRKTFAQLIAERMGESDYNEMVDNLIKRAKKKDRSFETLRDTVGEMPVKPVQLSQEEPFKIEIETINEDTKND